MSNKRRYKVVYDYRKRTPGGVIDSLFLVGIILTIALWGMIIIIGRC